MRITKIGRALFDVHRFFSLKRKSCATCFSNSIHPNAVCAGKNVLLSICNIFNIYRYNLDKIDDKLPLEDYSTRYTFSGKGGMDGFGDESPYSSEHAQSQNTTKNTLLFDSGVAVESIQ